MLITLEHKQNIVPLSYWDYQKNIESTRTIVFIHGLGDSKETWFDAFKHFKERYRLIALDLRGHGASKATNHDKLDFSVGQLLADIKQALKEVQAKRFVLIAHSIGVRIAIAFAAEFPSKVEALILEDLHLIPRPSPEIAYWLEKDLQQFEQFHHCYEDALHMAQSYGISSDMIIECDTNEYGYEYAILNNPYYEFLMLKHVSETEIAREAFKLLNLNNLPILLLQAEHNSLVSEIGLEEMLDLQPKMQHCVVEGSNHIIHYSAPERFNKLCEEFLDQIGIN